jgi:ABC-type microcin C transport system permease subunit YejB
MWYFARRLLYFVPTLLLIMMLTFFISRNTPGDPVEQQLQTRHTSGPGNTLDYWLAY